MNSVHSKSNTKRVYYPLFLDITGKECLVVGGGAVAARKVAMLLQFNARVTVVSPVLSTEIQQLDMQGKITVFQRPYTIHDLDSSALIFACTNDRIINTQIRKEASAKKIPVNVVDDPDLCDFIVPSIIKKGDLTIAISTAGQLPLLSRKLREKIEGTITDDYLQYLDIIGQFRNDLLRTVQNEEERHMIMKRIDAMEINEVISRGLPGIREIFKLELP